jgi:hypothetical protein
MDELSIEERLSRLEKANRQLKIALLAVVVLAGGSLWLSKAPGVRAQAPQWQQTIEAQGFVLRDSAGRPRAKLGVTGENWPLFQLLDDRGVQRVELSAVQDGGVVAFADASGRPRASLGWTETGPGVLLFDANGKTRAGLDLAETGPKLFLFDANGRGRAWLDLAETGPGLVLSDAKGRPRASLELTEKGPRLVLFDAKGRLIWSAP